MMTPSGCCEVWKTHSVFQGGVVKSKTCPWPRRLSAAGGSKREFTQLPVSKSLTRSGPVYLPVNSVISNDREDAVTSRF